MKRRRRFLGSAAALALAVLLLFAGCASPSLTQEDSTAPVVTEASQPAVAGEPGAPSDTQTAATGQGEASFSQPSVWEGTQAYVTNAPGQQPQTDTSPESPVPTQSVQEPARQGVSLSVTCHTAVANGIDRLPNYQGTGVIPQNGVIFEGQMLKLEEGDTALSLLRRTMKANGDIPVSAQRDYVRGIKGLYEKIPAYPNSGWMYRVNGVFPTIGCGKYLLNPGDTVEFLYTCVYGDLTA